MRGDPKLGARADHRLLQLRDVPAQVLPVAAQIQDRIGDELSWPVEGDIAAAIRLNDARASRRDLRF